MESYKCEATSVCSKYQSAFCLHCNHRLCLLHLTEHNTIIFTTVKNLSNEIDETCRQLNNESEKRKNIYNNILTSFDQWRIQQIDKIQTIYENQLQLIDSQRELLNHSQDKLFEQLQHDARRPLEYLQTQPNMNTDILNHIRQTIKQVREDNAYLKWNLATPSLPINIEYSPLTLPAMQIPTLVKHKSISKKTDAVHGKNGQCLKRVVQMFSNISSIEKSKNDLSNYIKNIGGTFKLPIFICSYLTAWTKTSQINEKILLLNEHISTIQKYLSYRKSDYDVLIGIQAFFYNEKIRGDKHELMTFLLQFFLNHQCITQNQILDWYNNDDIHGYKGFSYAKELATVFVNSYAKIQTDVNVKQQEEVLTNPTPVDQCYNITVKLEPIEST